MSKHSDRYRYPTTAELRNLEKYLDTINASAKFITDNLINRRLIYELNTGSNIELIVKRKGFAHLCGIEYGYGNNSFFGLATSQKRLDISKIKVKADGTTFLKLQVLPHLPDILERGIKVTSHGSFEYLRFDSALRTSKSLFALTLLNPPRVAYYVPESLINLKTRPLFPNGVEVAHLHSQSLQDSTMEELLF